MRHVSYREIATAADVSTMTVSRALRNAPNISTETRDRVLRVAEELGYRPDPLIQMLMDRTRTKRTKDQVSFAVVSKLSQSEIREAPYFEKIHAGLVEQALKLGYSIEHNVLDAGDHRTLSVALASRGVTGVIGLNTGDPAVLGMDWSPFATCLIGYHENAPQFHRVALDHYENFRLAVRQLRASGYRRIGFSCPEFLRAEYEERYHAAFYNFKATLPAGEVLLHEYPGMPHANAAQLRREDRALLDWISQERVDAVLAIDPWQEVRLRELGARIPEDFALASLEITDETGPIAGILPNYDVVGATAVDIVDGQLKRNERGSPQSGCLRTVRGIWKSGPTCPSPKVLGESYLT